MRAHTANEVMKLLIGLINEHAIRNADDDRFAPAAATRWAQFAMSHKLSFIHRRPLNEILILQARRKSCIIYPHRFILSITARKTRILLLYANFVNKHTNYAHAVIAFVNALRCAENSAFHATRDDFLRRQGSRLFTYYYIW